MVPHFEISQYFCYGTNRSSANNFFTVLSDSVCSCTWNRIPPKSLSYHGIASLHSLSRSLPFAALRRRFSNFMYVLMNLPDRIDLRWHWWYNPITRSIFFCNEIPRHHRILVPHFSQAFLDSSWRSGNLGRSTSNMAALFSTSFQKRLNFSSLLIFLACWQCFFSAAHRFPTCNDVLRLSLCLRRMPSLNPKK